MVNKYAIVSPTQQDFYVGKHLDWECAAHEAESESFKRTGKHWDYNQRRAWIDSYAVRTSYGVRESVRTCNVCAPLIADALLRGVDPFEVPAEVATRLIDFGIRLRKLRREENTHHSALE